MDNHAVTGPPLRKGGKCMDHETEGMLSSFFKWLASLAMAAAMITRQAEKFAEGQSAMGLAIVAVTAIATPSSRMTEIVWSLFAMASATFQGVAVLTMGKKARAKAALIAFCMWVTAIAWFLMHQMRFAVGLSLTSAIVSWLVYVFCNTSERLVYDGATDAEHGSTVGRANSTRNALKVLNRLSDSKAERRDSREGQEGARD